MSDTAPLTIALRVDDPALAQRLRELLTSVDGLRLAAEGEPSQLILSTAPASTAPVTTAEATTSPLTTAAADLTLREREVLALLAEGLSNKEIARKLGIALDTAKFHVGRVIDKLDATGRTDAVAHAARRGVIHL